MKKVIHVLIVLLLVSLFAIPAFYYIQLPQEIPSHFNAAGEVDDYSGKGMIWFLPALGWILVGLIWFVFKSLSKNGSTKSSNQLPELFEELLVLFILLLFNYISFTTIQVALGYEEGLGRWFLPTTIAVVFIGLMWNIRNKMGRTTKDK